MRYRDFEPPDGSGAWMGLDLMVERGDLGRGAPVFRVCAGNRRIRIECAGEPVLWSHEHAWRYGVWVLLGRRSRSWRVVSPTTRPVIASVEAPPHTEAWWRAWARWFARELVASSNTPLSAGRWAITAARASGAKSPPTPAAQPGWAYPHHTLACVEEVRTCLDAEPLGWKSWFLNGSGVLLRSRLTAPADAARPRAFRKRVRDGTLPPVLVMFVSGLDMYVLLDGHDRLRAALAEGTVPPLLELWKVRARPDEVSPELRDEVFRDVEKKQRLREHQGLLATKADNKRLIAAFDDRDTLEARTAAWPLVGGVERWVREVLGQGVPADAFIFRGDQPTLR